jgi:hypothetical protein
MIQQGELRLVAGPKAVVDLIELFLVIGQLAVHLLAPFLKGSDALILPGVGSLSSSPPLAAFLYGIGDQDNGRSRC